MAEGSPLDSADVSVVYTGDVVAVRVGTQTVGLSVEEAEEFARLIVEAAARAGGQTPEENDWVRIPMQYIRVAAERLDDAPELTGTDVPPNNEVPDTGDAKIAEVHCWIKDQTQQNAMHIVAGWIAEYGWFITEIIEHETVTSDDFADTEYLKYYEQAKMDSEVFLYEIDDTEADQDKADETEGSADAP
jgi:hypothetical protein